MFKRLREAWRDQRGSMAVEAALMFPALVLMLLMSIDAISYFSTIRKLAASAELTADLLASWNDDPAADVIIRPQPFHTPGEPIRSWHTIGIGE